MIKISVIVPVYNTGKYLEKCLNSIINQTLKEIEIIVVNDGSTDNSQEIIDKYAKKYSNIKSFIKKNGGLSDTRNVGLSKCQGEYVCFIDSDDYIRKDMLEKMYKKVLTDKADIVVCDSINVYENKKEVLIKSKLNYTDDLVKEYLLAPPMACTRLFRKCLFDKMNFKKGIFYEDLELCPKFVSGTSKISFVEEGLYYYVQRSGSIMKQENFNDKLLDIFKVLDSNRISLEKRYPEEIEYMYIAHLLRTASLRFLNYSNYQTHINKIINIMKNYFPKWYVNKYYKKSSRKFKLVCFLVYHKQYLLLKLIKKITNK